MALIVAPAVAQNAIPAAVSVNNFTFNPPKLIVKAGTKVTSTNTDDIINDSTTFTFTTPGTYQYFCYVHPHMVGRVVVQVATSSNEK